MFLHIFNGGPLIDALKQLKQVYHHLFEQRVASNPLIATVDDVVTYADVTHNVSHPKSIAPLLCRINLWKNEILNTQPKLRQLKIKKILLEIMLEDARELKTNQGITKTYLICPSNMSSTRSSQGIPYQDLTTQEIDEKINIIGSHIKQVDLEANQLIYPLQHQIFVL